MVSVSAKASQFAATMDPGFDAAHRPGESVGVLSPIEVA
jgi:hypothetical protein